MSIRWPLIKPVYSSAFLLVMMLFLSSFSSGFHISDAQTFFVHMVAVASSISCTTWMLWDLHGRGRPRIWFIRYFDLLILLGLPVYYEMRATITVSRCWVDTASNGDLYQRWLPTGSPTATTHSATEELYSELDLAWKTYLDARVREWQACIVITSLVM